MKRIKIEQTDVFLENFEKLGQGKITISDPWMGAFTYSWGAMGSGILEFIKRINPDYFAGKLCREDYVFDAKTSVKNIRKYIKDELKHELPYYKYPELQKEFRIELKKLEKCSTDNEFVDACFALPERMLCMGATFREENEFKDIISGIFKTEPWGFIAQKPSPKYIWLKKIHSELIKCIEAV
jgi:hypothetical protein